MANKTLFHTKNRNLKPTNTVNYANSPAYKFEDKQALAQLVVTSCFNGTFYAEAETQLNQVLDLARNVDSKFVAQAAVYSRQNAQMKDAGVLLLAVLASRQDGIEYFKKIFPLVINNVKQLCNFARIIRSGLAGRRNFGHAVRNTMNDWINSKDLDYLAKGAIGQSDPSLADVIKMVHTKPYNDKSSNFYSYLLGKNYSEKLLPPAVAHFERFKKDGGHVVPDMPFRALTNCKLTEDHWKQIALDMPWNTLRMNLNMLERNGVFKDKEMVRAIATKLADPREVANARVFPYQILTTYQNITGEIPNSVRGSLHDALEAATANIPSFDGDVVVAVDTSGSMSWTVTGNRGSVSSKTSCRDVAALFASCILRKNPDAIIIPFNDKIEKVVLDPRDTVLTNSQKIANFYGGTNCSIVLQDLNNKKAKADYVIYFSDNQSWADYYGHHASHSPMSQAWNEFKRRNPNAKLVLVDLLPYTNTQVSDSKDVLNVGGWNDSVFTVIHNFLYGSSDFVKTIESIEL